LVFKKQVVVAEQILSYDFTVFLVEILANNILIVGEWIRNYIFLEIDAIEGHFKKIYVLTSFMGECSLEPYNCVLPVS
jgi:hypothetical protein